jgi:aspartyl-tRNA(Asn)/glutamyl-tRNA(Gln) amidotransferase subunit A
MSEIAKLPAAELVRRYRRKDLSPVEVTKAALSRIDACNKAVNAFCVIDADQALASAAASEARWMKGEPCGLVDGVPTTIKDVVLTKGWPTLRGSRTTDPDQPWDIDAPCTARLREHGAVLLGKTTTPEFGWKGVTDNLVSGITRNPWNTDRTPGGSSGGAAAAAALGMGALHIGTDGGGSIRIPSGFTGVFGHKPSFGRVPAWPGSAFGTLSHVGPLTRTVTDAALMLNVITQPDARDWTALPFRERDYTIGLEDGVAGLRIAYSPVLGYVDVDPEIAALVRAAAEVMRDLGATVEKVDPGFNDPAETFRRQWARRSPSVNFWMLSKRAINWAKRCRSSTKHTTCCSHRRCPFLLSRQAKRSLTRTASRDGRFGLRLRSRSTLPSNLSLQHHAVSRVKDCPPVSKSLAQSMPMRWSCVPRVPTSPLVHSGCRTNRTCNIDGLER